MSQTGFSTKLRKQRRRSKRPRPEIRGFGAGVRPPCATRLGEELHLPQLDGDQEVQLPPAAAFRNHLELVGFLRAVEDDLVEPAEPLNV